eukprot:2160353-Pleurochrysis_carterae.AAC.1
MQEKLAEALGLDETDETDSPDGIAPAIRDMVAKQHSVHTANHRQTPWPLVCGFKAAALLYG